MVLVAFVNNKVTSVEITIVDESQNFDFEKGEITLGARPWE